MNYTDRNGTEYTQDSFQDKFLKGLYENPLGRGMVKILVQPWISKLAGGFLDTRFSKCLIAPFVKSHHIDLNICEKQKFSSYNDFFTRKLKEGARPVCQQDDALISPCDSRLSVYKINEKKDFLIKNTYYTLNSLLRDSKLSEKYKDGYICVFRLTVEDYHRYCYVDDGQRSHNRRIDGVLHTVNPVANDVRPIYKENTREYAVLRSQHFGDVLMMEVGALIVGKIVNNDGKEPKETGYDPVSHKSPVMVTRGQERGHFEFGGSTVILLLEKDKVEIDTDILENTKREFETIVKQGERIGTATGIEKNE